MIHPSYSELIQAINNNSEEDDNTILLNSRYSLVLATSKRARQIIGGSEPMVDGAAGKKPLSVAIDEFYKGKVKIIAKPHEEEASAKAAEPGSEAAEPGSEAGEVSEVTAEVSAETPEVSAEEAVTEDTATTEEE